MQVSVSVDIRAPRKSVWEIVSDIEHSGHVVSAIEKIEVLERPNAGAGLTGLKWRETRTMFGKQATETMWITASEEPAHYDTRAESHGAVYKTRIALDEIPEGTRLSMSFGAEPQTFGAKVMGIIFAGLMKSSLRKAIQKDLDDIKAAAEAKA